MKNIKLALVVTLAFAALFISFYNFFYLRNIEDRVGDVEKVVVNKGNVDDEVGVEEGSKDGDSVIEHEYITFTGVIKKEAIPEELELGDYWYWLYFDEPYLLEGNASGMPMNMDKLQIYAPEREAEGMDVFDGEHVEVTGYITWGYAESSVIQAEEIVVK